MTPASVMVTQNEQEYVERIYMLDEKKWIKLLRFGHAMYVELTNS